MHRVIAAAFCLILLAQGPSLAAEEQEASWARFRGPRMDNRSPDKGLLTSWPKNGPPLAWKASSIGGGYSSVAVSGGKVFTLGNKGNATHAFALDQSTGRILWSTKIGAAGGNLGCTPTVDGDRVYAIGQAGDLVCLKTADGSVVWKRNFVTDFDGHCGGWQYTESPLVDEDRLIATPGAKAATLAAFNKLTGETLWQCSVPGIETTAGYSSVVQAEVGGLKHYIQLISGGVVGVGTDGRFLWKYDRLGNNTANIPTPIVLKDRVFCSAGYGKGGALLSLKENDGTIEAKEIYFSHNLKNKHGGLVVVDDYVYGDHDDHGSPFCAELKSGKVMWRKERRGPGTGSAAVTYADGHLYFRFENGVVALVEADPQAYREVSTFKTPTTGGPSWAHPVVIGGRLYLREQDVLYVYDVKSRD